MDLLGRLVGVFRRAFPDFQYITAHKKSCMTHIIYSRVINQILVIKFPNRDHYICKKMAQSYLQSTRKTIEDELGQSFCKRAYTLSILISDKLTKSCFDLIVTDYKDKNMDMIFNPKRKNTTEKDILGAIFKALSTKCESWNTQIKKGCKRVKTSPFGDIRKKIEEIDNARDIFYYEYKKLKWRDS